MPPSSAYPTTRDSPVAASLATAQATPSAIAEARRPQAIRPSRASPSRASRASSNAAASPSHYEHHRLDVSPIPVTKPSAPKRSRHRAEPAFVPNAVPRGSVADQLVESRLQQRMDRRNSNTEKAAFSEEQQSSHPVRLRCCGVINEAPEHLHFSG